MNALHYTISCGLICSFVSCSAALKPTASDSDLSSCDSGTEAEDSEYNVVELISLQQSSGIFLNDKTTDDKRMQLMQYSIDHNQASGFKALLTHWPHLLDLYIGKDQIDLPLHYVVRKMNLLCLKTILAFCKTHKRINLKEYINTKNAEDDTALHLVVMNAASKIQRQTILLFIDLLLKHGADLALTNKFNMTPAVLAGKMGNPLLVADLIAREKLCRIAKTPAVTTPKTTSPEAPNA